MMIMVVIMMDDHHVRFCHHMRLCHLRLGHHASSAKAGTARPSEKPIVAKLLTLSFVRPEP
jgi:hypothetical protein